jgi:Zn-dependent peptidase ImmA (M78 family)
MGVDEGPEIASLKGEDCARDHELTSLPVDPFAVAKKADIEVYEKSSKPGVSGMLLRVGDLFAIAYATHVSSEGFRRFSVAHELGHYYLPGHVDHIIGADGVHESRAGFASGDRYEKEADQFAVGLLMPRAPFKRVLQSAGDGLGAVERMASVCRTSLTATAIRLAELTDDAVAVVVSNPDEIEFCAMSKSFRSLGITWLKRGTPIPKNTLTYRFNGDPARILNAERDDTATDLDAWFTVHRNNVDLSEEVIGLGRYEKTLTVLTVQEAPDEEEVEEKERLVESWKPTLGRSRRK